MDYKYLIGKEIVGLIETETSLHFLTDKEEIIIPKHEPYCGCGIGEYVDSIVYDGEISGVITDIDTDIEDDPDFFSDDTVYRGTVSILFDYKQINMQVSGQDNGYYGVAFRMEVTIKEREDKIHHQKEED